MADNDFKYMIQDISNIYIGARSTYEELAENEELPQKLREVIVRAFLSDKGQRFLSFHEEDEGSFPHERLGGSGWQEAKEIRLREPGIYTGRGG